MWSPALRPVMLLVIVGLLLCGCAETPAARPPRLGSSTGLPEWDLTGQSPARYELAHARSGQFLSILFTRDLPYPLGRTFVSDLALVIKNPRVGTFELPDEMIVATIARAPEVANPRTALVHATGGTLQIDEAVPGGFRGSARLKFADEYMGGDSYLVILRFAPIAR